MPEQNKDSATTVKTPAPGTPGGKMIGIAEQDRLQNPDPGPSEMVSEESLAKDQFEAATGKKIGEMSEADFYRVPVKLVAQNTSIATELSVELKDPAMACRWFNRQHKNGYMVQRALYSGFTPCTKEDVERCHATATDDNGALVMGDLVLLKMPKIRLWGGHYKQNAETAKYRVSQQLAKPFGASVKGEDNGSSIAGTSPYQITSQTGSTFVDAAEARQLAFGK